MSVQAVKQKISCALRAYRTSLPPMIRAAKPAFIRPSIPVKMTSVTRTLKAASGWPRPLWDKGAAAAPVLANGTRHKGRV
jgi:hypothetical protein